MDTEANLYLDRAENEIAAASSLKTISEDGKLKDNLNVEPNTTFYSSVISHSYYSIFYAARAYLVSKNVKISSEQGQHQEVYFKFKKLVEKGEVERNLLEIYEDVKDKAESLLEILKSERKKRTTFTYETLPQANKAPAEESLKNAIFFISHMRSFILGQSQFEKEE